MLTSVRKSLAIEPYSTLSRLDFKSLSIGRPNSTTIPHYQAIWAIWGETGSQTNASRTFGHFQRFYDLNRILLDFSRGKIDGSDAFMHLFLCLDKFQAIYRGFLRILRRFTMSDRDLSPTGIAGLVMLRS